MQDNLVIEARHWWSYCMNKRKLRPCRCESFRVGMLEKNCTTLSLSTWMIVGIWVHAINGMNEFNVITESLLPTFFFWSTNSSCTACRTPTCCIAFLLCIYVSVFVYEKIHDKEKPYRVPWKDPGMESRGPESRKPRPLGAEQKTIN